MDAYEPGEVRPLAPDGTELAPPPEPKRRRRGLVIGGVVIGVLVAGAIGAAFAWNRVVGDAFASADYVPIDADVVVTFDLLQVRDSDRLDRLVTAFTRPAAELGYIEDGDIDVLSEIDAGLEEETGFTLTDDVIPWIGRSVSIALWFDPEDLGSENPEEIGGVVIAGVRDRAAAAQFVRNLTVTLEDENGSTAESSTLDGGDLTIIPTDEPDIDGVVIYLDDDVVILSPREADVRQTLAARDGSSIRDLDLYEDTIAALPSDRLIVGYIDMQWVDDAFASDMALLGPEAAVVQEQLGDFRALGMSTSLHDEGLRFDTVSVMASDIEVGAVEAASYPARLPDETLGFISWPLPEGTVEQMLDQVRSMDPSTYDDIVAEAEQAVGFDLINDTLPSLGREMILAVVETPTGLFADQFGTPVGAALGIGITDPEPVAEAIARLEDMAVDAGLQLGGQGDVTEVRADGQPVFAYGFSRGDLALATDAAIVDLLLAGAGGTGLEAQPRFARLDELLAGDGLTVYVDLQGLFDAFEWLDESRAIVDPLQAIGATGVTDGNVSSNTLFVTIDY